MKNSKRNLNTGITLIALVITIIVLLILAAISIATLTGDNGILSKASEADIKTDITETKEKIKLEIMGNVDDNGNYTNEDVIEAVKKITKKDVEKNTEIVKSEKGNDVNIADLWREVKVSFTLKCGDENLSGLFEVDNGTTWEQFFIKNFANDWYGWLYSEDGRIIAFAYEHTTGSAYGYELVDKNGRVVLKNDLIVARFI